MLQYFGLSLLLVATILGASLPRTFEQQELLKNDNRIVGGRKVDIVRHPHQVSLRRKASNSTAFRHTCGGSIYKANVIITAAHCVFGRKANNYIIVAGTNNRIGGDGAVALVEKIIVHEKYDSYLTNNDIALMFLSTPLPVNNITIAPIPLTIKEPQHGSKAVITGWGTTSFGGYSSNDLLEVEAPIVDRERCDSLYAVTYSPGRISKSMICAGREGVGGKDACQGDSGGPLLVNNQLAGVVSWGHGCALPNYPGIYTNVALFVDWIDTTIKENS